MLTSAGGILALLKDQNQVYIKKLGCLNLELNYGALE